MRTSYQKSRLSEVQYILGDYFNIAVNNYNLTLEKALKKLLVSKYSKLIEKGNSSIVFGKTGYELFYDVMISTSDQEFHKKNINIKLNTKEFWIGWILAYFQWSTSKSFDSINDRLPIENIAKLYNPYHEMDERSFVIDINNKYFEENTNLNLIRKRNQLTQAELAKRATVSIRTIQMLEQRQNDINKSKAINLFNISKVLHCTMEDLLE